MRILVIEDEIKVAGFIERGLKEEKYAVDVALNAQGAITLLDLYPYDLITLDLMLPDMDGLALCRVIRSKKIQTPILMLTARSAVEERVKGLDAGADDYLPKPFAFEELLARIRSLMRRKSNEKVTTLKVADLELDILRHTVKRAGNEITLTAKEYSLLEYLMKNVNQVVTRTMISEHVWNEHFDSFSNVIDVHINYLRNKIDKGFSPTLIYTLRGTGYMLKEP
jgi:DNA-binding response OmpR family regulator